MRSAIVMTALAALMAASAAIAQDAPPPGCRWQGGDTLACKDGKGYWRRSGDGEIVGTYPIAKPKPKPKPQPTATATGATAVAAQAPATPTSAELLPPPPPPPPEEETVAAAASPAPPVAPAATPAPAAAPAAPDPPKSWWRRWLDDIMSDLRAFLRLFGLGR